MIKVLLFAALVPGIIFIYVKYIEARSVFYPSKDIVSTPSSLNLAFEDIYLKTADKVTIHSWFIPAYDAAYTILFFHGNAGNIGDRLDKILIFHQIGLNILIIDYRGFGKSSGKPSEEGVYRDAETAYKYLVESRKARPAEIIAYGESLGGAVAVDLASKVTLGGLIVEETFSRGRDMAKKLYPYLPAFLFSNIFDSLSKIKKVRAQKLFIHSSNDELVPLALAKNLYDEANEPKDFIQIEGSHNQAFLDSKEKFVSSLKSFINKLK